MKAYSLTATDGNGDGDVNFADFLTFAGKFGSRLGQERYDARCDGDGQIDSADFFIFADSFDPTTRTLSGMPSEAKAQATYTLSALDADGDVASLPFTLEVSLPSPDLDGDGNVNFADFLTFASKFGSRLGQERYDSRRTYARVIGIAGVLSCCLK